MDDVNIYYGTTISRPARIGIAKTKRRLTDKQAIAMAHRLDGPLLFASEGDCTRKNLLGIVGILRSAPGNYR